MRLVGPTEPNLMHILKVFGTVLLFSVYPPPYRLAQECLQEVDTGD